MRKQFITTGLAALASMAMLVAPVSALSTNVVYDATPSTLPPNVASLGYEATSTSEFGDYVHLAGTSRNLNSVTVTMSDWALRADYPSLPDAGWTHPITVNVYSNHLGTNGAPDTLLATKTQTVNIPWRPAGDDTCPTSGGVHGYRAADNLCYNGKAFNATIDMSSANVTLPNDVIVGVAYNTADYGTAPLHAPGPYNSLNVGIPDGQTASVGTDDSANNVFWNTSFAGFYADGGSGGVGTFRQDTGWAPNGTVALKITASSTVNQPTSKDACKGDGWKSLTDASGNSFKNQGDCVSNVATKGKNPASSLPTF